MAPQSTAKSPAKWDPLTPLLVRASNLACNVPIHTVITVSLLAVFSYVHLLSDIHISQSTRGLGIANLRDKRFVVGEKTKWNWEETGVDTTPAGYENSRKAVIVTLEFPEDYAENAPAISVPAFANAVALESPRQGSFPYAVPQNHLKAFLESVMQIPVDSARPEHRSEKWVVTVGNENRNKYNGAWYGFLFEKLDDLWDLLEKADSFDIGIMVVGYVAMHGTFINLFVSMRRLGSRFWLASSVLISSTFAFFIAAFVTKALGVPINLVLLSEGLPFLVIVIGFEKPIILTRHVLSQSIESRKKAKADSINAVVLGAVQERGLEIARLYALEIFVLIVGAILGVQGLRQFCFLAAWILFFDFVLLFSFYTAVLTFKLEINRIKRHATIRKALEEDGISHKAAESYASATEWPKSNLEVYSDSNKSGSTAMFGNKSYGVRTFKVLMVGTFFILNVLYIASFWFRERADAISLFKSMEKTIPEVHTMSNEESLSLLNQISKLAKEQTVVTILKPLGYILERPSSTFPSSSASGAYSYLAESAKDSLFSTHELQTGPRLLTFTGVVRSLQDPLLSRFLIAILIFSVGLNGVLFNVARWSAKDDAFKQHFQPTAAPVEKPTKICTCGGLMESDDESLEMKKEVPSRSTEEALAMIVDKRSNELSDRELVNLCGTNKLLVRDLERKLGDTTRAVKIRRKVLSLDKSIGPKGQTLDRCKLPYLHYDFDRVLGACCENVVGYLPLPLGIAGPLVIDGEKYYIPMATTEGVLVASASRGCKAINSGGGAITVLLDDGMTRGPCVTFPTLKQAGAAKNWLDSDDGQSTMKAAFDSTSRFARLKSIKTALAGTYLYIRFKCTTGDAMGMNMISKGVEHALSVMANDCGFSDMQIVSVSGNYCTDKKPAAINWIEGRGKSVVAEAIIPAQVVKSVLKCDVDGIVELNISKNLVGSAMAGSVGGFNAHAANIVTAIFLATGQDPAQNVESSNCITLMKKTANGDLQISVSMPSIEVGTLGGGTILDPQGAMLDLLGVKGTHPEGPGQNARKLARIIAASVLAGELSLCSALVAGHLVKSHMQHNRSAAPTRANTPAPPSAVASSPSSTERDQAIASLRMTASK